MPFSPSLTTPRAPGRHGTHSPQAALGRTLKLEIRKGSAATTELTQAFTPVPDTASLLGGCHSGDGNAYPRRNCLDDESKACNDLTRCTRSVSDFRNSCSALSSEVSPSSSLIELDVRRATEDLILRLDARILWGASDYPAPSDRRFSVSAVDFVDSDFLATSSDRLVSMHLPPNTPTHVIRMKE
jgi:hypothetical protein